MIPGVSKRWEDLFFHLLLASGHISRFLLGLGFSARHLSSIMYLPLQLPRIFHILSTHRLLWRGQMSGKVWRMKERARNSAPTHTYITAIFSL